jgi:hypothetical protein
VTTTLLAACGSDNTTTAAPAATKTPSTSAPTDAPSGDFVSAANAICSASDTATTAIFSTMAAPGASPTPAEQQAALDGFLVEAHKTVDQLAAITPPADVAAKYQEMISAFGSAADQVQQEGLAFFGQTSGPDPFAAASKLAGELNLTDCITG